LIFMLSLLWALILFSNWSLIEEKIEYFLTILPFQTVAQGIAALLALYVLYNLFLISEYFVVFIFREPFISALLERHYPDLPISRGGLDGRAYRRLGLDLLLFFTLSLLSLPLLFIPIANFLVVWFLWTWLYKESAFLGVCSLLCSPQEYGKLRQQKLSLLGASLLAALLNFIPIISFFTPFFVMTLYFHWIVEEKRGEEGERV
ncbi:MAG: hypothetical protein GXO19_04095, partial [Epsilonproteobacteria bacterium]|nr:hypothetical protein [Campylobacterota bacterium]NPA56903.1 hypothetical protein [Campylobacterota bacterium]